MIIVDTCALLAFYKVDDPDHDAVAHVVEDHAGSLVVSPYVVAELDHLVRTRMGVAAELSVLHELAEGRYELPVLGSTDLLACWRILALYGKRAIGVTDASLVVLADRYGTDRICTLDRRDFSILRTVDGAPFTLLP